MTPADAVAVLGAGGMMGFPMARNLARAGINVRAWNRSPVKAQPLTDDGAQVFESPGEAVGGARIILTMLADAGAVLDSVRAALSSIREGAIWLQMSTIGEEGTQRCVELARQHDVEFIDAPVLGTRQPAEEAKLVVLAAGPQHLREAVADVFDAVGQRTIWLEEPGEATKLKLVTNSWVLTVVEGTAETVALAEGLGLDPALLLEALEGGALDLPYLRMKSQAIIERDFEPSFRLALATKDARLIEEAAQRHELDLPLISLIRERFQQGLAEHGDEDMIATYFASAPETAGRGG